ncbi:MAG TPA: hypothetical protein VGM69_07855 [Chloroflexota bacterium]|jgi:hypothetical protein
MALTTASVGQNARPRTNVNKALLLVRVVLVALAFVVLFVIGL